MIEIELGGSLLMQGIEKALGKKILISHDMQTALVLWEQLYRNQPPWVSESVKSLSLPTTIAGELACQATLDFTLELSGSSRADMIHKQVFEKLVFDLRRCVEQACAYGGIVFKPYLDKRRLAVEYVPAQRFFPLATDSRGRIVSAVFAEQIKRNHRIYTRLEEHVLEPDGVRVRNLAFEGNGLLGPGRPVSLSCLPEWEMLAEEVTLKGAERPLFAYLKMPLLNTVDMDSPLGISVFARAVDLMKEADLQFSRLLWEYEGGELAVDASVDALLLEGGDMKMPNLNKRLFRALDVEMEHGDLYSVFAPALRDASYLNGLNEVLIRIEDLCGLARGTISNMNYTARTATELNLLRQRSYATVTDIQKSLQAAMLELADALDMMTTVFSLAPAGKYTLTFEFDDSVVTDRASQFEEMKFLAERGIINKWEFRSWYLGETEQQAKEKLSEIEVSVVS
ncbi:MAG: phage portal protein [Clostridia bacterium]|nr:phage portal protein [Clostridia bacterium]